MIIHLTPARRRAVRTVLGAAVVLTAIGCDRSDDGRRADAATDTGAWCQQFDAFITATARMEALGPDDPAFDDALTAMQDETTGLADLATPAEIAGDWDAVAAPPSTTDTGGFDLGGSRAESGARIAAWALDTCDLSGDARAALDQESAD